MPYDTLCHGETTQNSGLAGVAGLGGQNHAESGDTMELLTEDQIWLQGLGGTSDTKPNGCSLTPKNLMAALPIYGPAAINFYWDGWALWMRDAPLKMFKADILTGKVNNTNVSEGTILAYDIVYGNPLPPWDLRAIQSKYKRLFTEQLTITSATAVVFNSGKVKLDAAALNEAKWLDPDATYEILGTIAQLSAATFGGIMTVTNLAGPWKGFQPGLIVSSLSAVTFNAGYGSLCKALAPIPFKGDALPSVGMLAPSAGAVTVGVLLGEL